MSTHTTSTLTPTATTKLSLKVSYLNDIRRMAVENPSFGGLKEMLCKLFRISECEWKEIDVRYKDDEGDMITVSSDEELHESLVLLQTTQQPVATLKLFLVKRVITPSSPAQVPSHFERRRHGWRQWRELQRTALNLFDSDKKEDLETARSLLLQQSALDPTHPIPLYNLACIESRLQNLPSALNYLEKSISAGYRDHVHMESDSDLESLRSLPQYQAIISSLKALPAQSCPMGRQAFWASGKCWKEGGRCGREGGRRWGFMHKWFQLERQIHELFESGSREDLIGARELLLKQWAMKPGSSHPVYNLACVEARLGNLADAMKYLTKAVQAGWNDVCHIENDSDLENLRELEEYKALVSSLKTQSPPTPVQPQPAVPTPQPVQPEQPQPAGSSQPHPNPWLPHWQNLAQHWQTMQNQLQQVFQNGEPDWLDFISNNSEFQRATSHRQQSNQQQPPVPQQQPPVPQQQPVQQRFEEQLRVLEGLGLIDKEKNVAALEKSGGDVVEAINILFTV